MSRPRSIKLFENCYLSAVAVGIVNTVLHWNLMQALPQIQQANAYIGAWYAPTIAAIAVAVPLLLWYFIARRASVVAKWIATVLVVIGLVGPFISVVTGTFPAALAAVLSIVAVVLNMIAITMLFRPDARAWFGETPSEPAV